MKACARPRHPLGLRRHTQRIATPCSTLRLQSTDTQEVAAKELWQQFTANATGEWECVMVTFSPDGKPTPLPERMRAEEGTLHYRIRKMMPTVGCEADAVAFTEEWQTLWAEPGAPRMVFPDGSYFAGPSSIPADSTEFKLQFCIVKPGSAPVDRFRVEVFVSKHWQTQAWGPARFEVHSEQYEEEYRGGVELLGCAGGNRLFAKEPPTQVKDTEEQGWKASAACFHDATTQGGLREGPAAAAAGLEGLEATTTTLPLGLFVRFIAAPPAAGIDAGATLQAEVGVVLEPGKTRLVARAVYSQSCLASYSVTTEQRG